MTGSLTGRAKEQLLVHMRAPLQRTDVGEQRHGFTRGVAILLRRIILAGLGAWDINAVIAL
jgi:hypothetical protein